MWDDKWWDLVDNIKSRFEVLEDEKEDLEDLPRAYVERIVFMGPMGKMKIERTTKPRVVGEKTFGGSKYGAASGVEKMYSEDEFVHVMKAYREADGEWIEMDGEMLG